MHAKHIRLRGEYVLAEHLFANLLIAKYVHTRGPVFVTTFCMIVFLCLIMVATMLTTLSARQAHSN